MSANWIEVNKNSLWKHTKTDTFLKKENGVFVIYDQSNFDIKIPVIDFMESPAGEFLTRFDLNETNINLLRTDVNFLFNNQSALFIEVLAKQNLVKNELATVDGKKADSMNTLDRAVGFVTENKNINENVKIQISGLVENSSWNFNVSNDLFLNANTISETATRSNQRFLQKVGEAVTSQKVLIKIGEPIFLNLL